MIECPGRVLTIINDSNPNSVGLLLVTDQGPKIQAYDRIMGCKMASFLTSRDHGDCGEVSLQGLKIMKFFPLLRDAKCLAEDSLC